MIFMIYFHTWKMSVLAPSVDFVFKAQQNSPPGVTVYVSPSMLDTSCSPQTERSSGTHWKR